MMSKKSLLLLPLAALLIPSTSLAADGIDCHPDSKKLEWWVCVVKPVEYKRGMKTESREECAINKKLDVKGCNLGNLLSYLPAGEDMTSFYVYAIGPADFDDTAWEDQQNNEDNNCSIGVGRLESHRLTKFSDAFDKSNRERGVDFDEKLKAKKLMLLNNGTLNPRPFSGKHCNGKKAATGKMDAKTLSKFLFYVEMVFPGEPPPPPVEAE
jgi:hypothetical protein